MTTGDWFDSEGTNWLLQNGYEDHPWNIIYLASYHWALAQFGLASSPIAASNGPEWTYSILVLFLGIVISALIVSTVTGMMTQWQQVNNDLLIQSAQLQRFFVENGVSADLTDCITHWFRQKYEERKRRVHEKDLLFINDLPEALRMTLRREVYLPIFRTHPFFNSALGVCPNAIYMLSYVAMSQHFARAQEIIWSCGEKPKFMVFVKSGDVEYLPHVFPDITQNGLQDGHEPPSPKPGEQRSSRRSNHSDAKSVCSQRSGRLDRQDMLNAGFSGKLTAGRTSLKSAQSDARSLISQTSTAMNGRYSNHVTGTYFIPGTEIKVPPGSYAGEACLWRKWRHEGDLVAVTSSELVCLDCHKWVLVLQNLEPELMVHFQEYARNFTEHVLRCEEDDGLSKVADVCEDREILKTFVKHAFTKEQRAQTIKELCSYNGVMNSLRESVFVRMSGGSKKHSRVIKKGLNESMVSEPDTNELVSGRPSMRLSLFSTGRQTISTGLRNSFLGRSQPAGVRSGDVDFGAVPVAAAPSVRSRSP
eukprot:gnl/TRDRNA2_/TRDRNA2_173149_c1_seq1.p1 gnl/TRDRNA2_/TRDRNA2_173149_c1~~gnl/TRDRNA2_/TRDRNA2_173149_c1_seq1.p1  ORF type:complete len:604 (-),score=73.53 gnl/TRDRNA2_/TRDRNA2_173149_c1_seq1:71-1669(-)